MTFAGDLVCRECGECFRVDVARDELGIFVQLLDAHAEEHAAEARRIAEEHAAEQRRVAEEQRREDYFTSRAKDYRVHDAARRADP
jgi:hypothetical protein